MVTVTGFKETENKEGKIFNVLELEGEVELIRSTQTGKFYAHAHKATITSTLNLATCKALVGKKFPGSIKKIETEPYSYKVPGTDDTIMLSHTYQYVEESVSVESAVFQGEVQ